MLKSNTKQIKQFIQQNFYVKFQKRQNYKNKIIISYLTKQKQPTNINIVVFDNYYEIYNDNNLIYNENIQNNQINQSKLYLAIFNFLLSDYAKKLLISDHYI